MVFSSLTFIYLFLPVGFMLYFLSPKQAWRNAVLVALSLFFYAWGEPFCVLLLMFSTFVDYINSLIIDRYRKHPFIPKLMVGVSVAVNLGILFVFKYSGFIMASFNDMTGLALPVPVIALPIGISFYTFQTLSYTIDVYRGDVPAQRYYHKLLMYVSMFHQLVAGPIVRYSHIAEAIDNRTVTAADLSAGINRFMVGLTKKSLLANTCGQLSTTYLGAPLSGMTAATAWFGLFVYSMQYYFDFSGYSDMAIGLGRMFGFRYFENFNYPFISQSVSEYWRRWHISLGTWFKDYLFYPLMMSNGFRRLGKAVKGRYGRKAGSTVPTVVALLIVWFATGMWHGAYWNYIVWGLYFGILLILEMLFLGKWLEKLPRLFRHAYLIVAVMLGFGIFYFEDFSGFWPFLGVLFGFGNGADATLALTLESNIFFLMAAVFFCTPAMSALRAWCIRHDPACEPYLELLHVPLNVLLLLLSTAYLVGQSYNPFMYFRF